MISLIKKSLAIMLLPLSLYALTGIGVSDWASGSYGSFDQIRAYYIEQNELVKMDTVYAGAVTCPAINTFGTHVAFFRQTDSDKTVVCVVNLKNLSKIKDLVAIQAGTNYGNRGYLDWPRGNWVYYNPARPMVEIRRVNVHTGTDESVLAISNWGEQVGMCEWRMSTADGRLLHTNVKARHVLEMNGSGKLIHSDWANGGTKVGGGCTPTISPSGRFITATTDAGHSGHGVTEVKFSPRELASVGKTTQVDWDNWAAGTWPQDQGGVFGGNCGNSGSSFSVNSDKWICYLSGIDGRFMKQNANLIAVNWKDSIAVNVSKYRSRDKSGETHKLGNLDFWVQEPLDDVLLELRDDAAEANRSVYCISGLDNSCNPTDAGHQVRSKALAAATIHKTANKLTVTFPSPTQYSIRIVNANGALVIQRSGNASFKVITIPSSAARRMLFIQVKTEYQRMYTKTLAL